MNLLEKHDQYELEILNHVEETPLLTNRILASKLGCSIKLAHLVLTGMVDRGLLHVKKLHSRRWDYFLTPKGISEKARLTYEFLDFSMKFYSEARKKSSQVCRDIAEGGMKEVGLIGADDLAEIVYLGIKEWNLELISVYAEDKAELLGHKCRPYDEIKDFKGDSLIVCLYDKKFPMSKSYLPSNIGKANNMRWVF
jgi:predicted transcriptional regulator